MEKYYCVCLLWCSLAAGAPSLSVHLPAAPVHSGASHGSPLCGRAQQDSHAGDYEQFPRVCTPLVSCYWRLHQTGGCHRGFGLYPSQTAWVKNSVEKLLRIKASTLWLSLCYSCTVVSLTAIPAGVMEQLDVDIVPYIVLLVVPVLGRMSDPSDSIRFMATQCFATLIRLLPLEVRAHKRRLNVFLMQLRVSAKYWDRSGG